MADVKWIKLYIDMFDKRKIKKIRRLPAGNDILLIWIMFLSMAGQCNAGGMIYITENVPFTEEDLAGELDFDINTIRLAVRAFKQLDMIAVSDDGFISVVGWEEHQNTDKLEEIREQTRKRVAKCREKKLLSTGNVTGNATVTQCNGIEEDKEEDKRKRNKSVVETTHELLERLSSDYSLSEELKAKMAEWVKYKTERKETYKEQGMKSLLRQVETKASKFGDKAICELIDECMANGWKGIIFERIKDAPQKVESTFETDDFFEAALARSYRGE